MPCRLNATTTKAIKTKAPCPFPELSSTYWLVARVVPSSRILSLDESKHPNSHLDFFGQTKLNMLVDVH
jgi:hypothetical protein